MKDNDKKYSIDDIYVGMTVSESSLSDIHDIYITLVNSHEEDNDIVGTIAFIGSTLDSEADSVIDTYNNICSIYNSSAENEGVVVYDE